MFHDFLSSDDFSFQNYIYSYPQKYHKSVKQFGPRSGPTFWSGLIWVQIVCKRFQQTTVAGNELNDLFAILHCSIVSNDVLTEIAIKKIHVSFL